MSRLLRRSALRHHLRHPWQTGLSILGVALGVAVVVSIDLATASAREAFRISTETVAGRATHQITAVGEGLPDTLPSVLRRLEGVDAVAPLVEEAIGAPALPGRAFRMIGVDPLSEGSIRPFLAGGPSGLDAAGLMVRPGAALVTAGTAADLGASEGDPLTVEVGGRLAELRVGGVLEPGSERTGRGLSDLVVVDIALAQELVDRIGRIDRIDLILDEGTAAGSTTAAIMDVLPSNARLEPTGARTATLAEMIRAFDLNLRALGLLALVFGAFLIYNTVSFSVVQRREWIGGLRALGVSRRQVLRSMAGEAAVAGAVGAALGVGLGIVLGRGLVRLVTRTINDLYFTVSVESVAIDPTVLVQGWALGFAVTLVAALPGILEAVGTTPRASQTRSFVEEKARNLAPRAAVAGIILMGVGGILLLIPSRSVVLGFASLFGIILGAALLTPLASIALLRVALPVVKRGLGMVGVLATRGIGASLSRTGPAVAALVVAVSVTVGLGVMISSFRTSVVDWLDVTLEGDAYVSVPSPGSGRPDVPLDPEAVERLAAAPGVRGVVRYRAGEVRVEVGEDGGGRVEVDTPDGARGSRASEAAGASRTSVVQVAAIDPDPGVSPGLEILEGDEARAHATVRSGGGVLLSEPLSFRLGVGVGEALRLRGRLGSQELPVVAVFRDYGSERGVLMMSGDGYVGLQGVGEPSSLAIFAEEGVEPDALVASLREAVAYEGAQRILIQSNETLRTGSLKVFDQTFAITRVLRLLAFLVAFIGILSALMALQLERRREMGVLRATGLLPEQLLALVTAQTGLLGSVAGLLALPLGATLALVMVYVVNRRSFGWTLDLSFGWGLVAQSVLLALLGSLLAGLYPAWKMSRTSPAVALREE